MKNLFNKDYFVNSDISNYTDYRKKKFEGLADDLYPYLKWKTVLDYGAATGGLVYELSNRLIYCEGTDISLWAIEYGKKYYNLGQRLHYYNHDLLLMHFDVVLFLDVLEHIPSEELKVILTNLNALELIIRIPVSANEGEDFVLDVSKNDKTHIQVHSKKWWLDLFSNAGYNKFIPLIEKNIYDSEGVLAGIFTNK